MILPCVLFGAMRVKIFNLIRDYLAKRVTEVSDIGFCFKNSENFVLLLRGAVRTLPKISDGAFCENSSILDV